MHIFIVMHCSKIWITKWFTDSFVCFCMNLYPVTHWKGHEKVKFYIKLIYMKLRVPEVK